MRFADAPIPRDQIALIPVTLGELIAPDHPIRLLDELLDQLDWSPFNERYKIEDRGRPPIKPKTLVAIWIYSHFRRVLSSRQVEYQLKNNVEFMWLAHGHQIDHSTLADFRRNNAKAIKDINRQLIRKAKDLGVLKIGALYIDGTRIKANANRSRTMTADKATKLLDFVQSEIDAFLKESEAADMVDDLFDGEVNGQRLPEHLQTLEQRKKQLETFRDTCQAADEVRKKQGLDTQKSPFQLPVTDPDSRVLPNKEGGYAPNYTPVMAVEGEYGLIVSSVIINTANEHDCVIGLVDEVESDYGVVVETIGADAAFSTGSNIQELEAEREKNFLSPHRKSVIAKDNPAIREDPTQPVAESEWPKLPLNPSTKRFSSAAFVYDKEADLYYCPTGRPLNIRHKDRRTLSNGESVRLTRYYTESCDGCPALALCRVKKESKRTRSVQRDEYAEVREVHLAKMETDEAKEAYKKRFHFSESPNGQIKEGFGVRRFQTRGAEPVESEFGLGQMAHNVLRILNIPAILGALRTQKSSLQPNG